MTVATPTSASRRPIAARQRPFWIRTSQRLAQRGVTPNAISLTGMNASICAGIALAATSRVPAGARALWFFAAVLVQLRLICNLLDGMVAIESGKRTPAGELYNEVPDRVSDAATFIGLGFAAGAVPTLGYIAAILAFFVAYIRAAARVAGAPQDYSGPMAKQHRMFLVTVLGVYMAFTPTDWQPIMSHRWGIPAGALSIIILGSLLTAWRRLARAASFLNSAAKQSPL